VEVKLSALRAGRTSPPQGRFLVLISVRYHTFFLASEDTQNRFYEEQEILPDSAKKKKKSPTFRKKKKLLNSKKNYFNKLMVK
jgi:hypothetical protein